MEKPIMIINKKNKIPILVVGPGANQVGGVSTFIEILLSSPILRERYDLIHLDTTRASGDLGLENRFSITNLTYFIRQIFQFIRIVVRMRPRLVHLQVTSGLAFWKTAAFILMGKSLGLKTVAHLHGGMFDHYYRKNSSLRQRLIGRVLHSADVVITLSEKWRRFLLNEVESKIRIVVVSNTVDLMFANAVDRANDNDLTKRKIILFLGSLGQRKGVFDILQAVPLVFDKHPDALFFFAGGEESRGEKLHIDRVCKENQLTGKITFLGQVTGDAKLKLFQGAMIYILPSYGENLPFALLEAMAVGLPVITTPVGAISEIVLDGENGFLIEPGDYRALANRIDQLLNDDNLRIAMSQANLSRIRAEYLPEVSMKLIDNIYYQLTSGS
jgi:glycosyltransferase involved in cell wall biosynthesis